MSKKVRKVSRIDDPNIEAQIDEIIRVVNSLDARTEDADAKATVNTQPSLVFREFPSDPVFGNCEFVYDVTLRWYKAEGAIMYEIRTDLNWGNESGRVYLGSALQYSFIPGQRYYTFYIKSINPAGKYSQGYDEIILEKPVPSIPDPPEAMPFFSAVKIIPAPNHEQGILGHYAYVTIEGETDKVDIPIGSSHAYNAPSGTEMTIEMSAYDILGEGGKSAPVTASTLKLSDRDIPEEIIEPSNLVKSLREDIDLTKTRAIDALEWLEDLDEDLESVLARIAHSIFLSNEHQSFVTEADGKVVSVTTVRTDIEVYYGTGRIAATIGTPVVKSSTGTTLSVGTFTKQNPTVYGAGFVEWSIPANTNVEADSGWIEIPITVEGIEYTKKLSWSKAKRGATGPSGAPAPQVKVRYSTDSTGPWYDDYATGRKWMQISVDGGSTWSTAAKIVGEDGSAGKDGKYTDYQFAKNQSKTSAPPSSQFTDAPPALGDGEFLWMRSRTVSPPDPPPAWNTPVRISGDKGDKGDPAPTLKVQYSTASSGATWYDDYATGRKWMRTSADNGATWSTPAKIVGEDGSDGVDGKYTDYQFAKNTSLTTAPTSGWTDAPPSLETTEYLWMRSRVVTPSGAGSWSTAVRISGPQGAKGDKGDKGDPGEDARLVNIVASHQFFTGEDQGDPPTRVYTPTSIVLTPQFQNCSFSKWQYSTNGTSWTDVTSGQNGLTIDSTTKALTIARTSNLFTAVQNQITFKVLTTTGEFDITTIGRIYDSEKLVVKMDTEINKLDNAIQLRAVKTEVYTKTETDSKLGTKVDTTTYNQKVGELTTSIEGIIGKVSNIETTSAILKPTGGKLWHFDISLESTDGIKPLEGAVATLRHDEGRFGGAVAVEEGTTNLIPSERLRFEGWVAYQGAEVTVTQGYGIPGVTPDGATRIQTVGGTALIKYYTARSSDPGNPASLSVWVYNIGQKTVQVRGNVIPGTIDVAPGEIKRCTLSTSSLGSGERQIQFYALEANDSLDFIAYQPQIEAKPFATSFVDGTRPDGILAYPIALKDNYTIACYRKSHTDEDYKHVVKRSDGKVFVDGVEDSEYDVGWLSYDGDTLMLSNQTGLIDELLVLDYAATEDEIQQWYRTTAPFYDPAELGFVGSQVQQLADKWTVTIQKTVDDKNVATGFGLAIGEDDISEFAVLADRFRVFGSLDEEGDGTALFVVDAQTNKAYLNVEEVIAAGAIKAEHLEADSVLAYLVQAGFAQFDEANVLDLLVDRRIRVGDNLEIGGNRIVVGGYETVSETVRITEDVFVRGGAPGFVDSNYSGSTSLGLGGDSSEPDHSLLKFNLPSGNITSATLRLYGELPSSGPFYIRVLKGDWNFQTVTWNNRPASDLVITTPTYQWWEGDRWFEIDITPVIQLWKQGQQNYGIEIYYYGGEAYAYSSRHPNPAYHPHVVFTVSSEEKLPKAVFGDLEGLDWLDKTLPAGEHGFWGKGVRIIGDIASADKEGNYSVLSGGRLAFFRATQWDEHGNPIAHSKAMYPAQIVSGTANSGQVVDLYAQGYRFLSEPKIIVFPNFNRTYLANHQGQDVWINWKVEAVDDDTPIFNPVSGAVKFRVRVETTVKGGDDLAAENSLTRRRLQGTGELSTAEGETGSGATSLRVKCTSYLRLRREYEDGFYYYQGHQEYWVYYRRKGTSQWKILGEHSHWDYRFGSPSGTPPIVNESKVFEVPLSPAGVYEIRVVLTTWGLYDSYVYIDAFKYRSQDTISSVDESEMVNYLVIDGG